MKELIKTTAKKYQLEEILNDIDSLESPVHVSIGLLGEFNSGKSTLINALIGEKMLPTMEVPTTKSITEIECVDNLEQNLYFKKTDTGELIEIDQDEFRDIAMGKIKGTCLLKIKSNDYLGAGFKIIDTPGLSNFEEIDTDITYGYLPFLDSAIICVDLNKGNLNASIINFLLKDEIKLISNNLLFALTHLSQKNPVNAQEIRMNVIKTLSENKLQITDIENRVILLDSVAVLNKNPEYSFKDFSEILKKHIFDKKQGLIDVRIQKKLNVIGTEILFLLNDKLTNFDLSDHEMNKKKEDLETDRELIKKKIIVEEEVFNKLKKEIESSIFEITTNFSYLYSNSSEENIKEISRTMIEQIHETITNKTEKVLREIKLNDLRYITHNLESELLEIDKITNFCKLIATVAISTAVLPGSGAAATISEGTLGGVVQASGQELTKKTVQNTGKKVLKKAGEDAVKNTLKKSGEKVVENTLKDSMKEGFLKVLPYLGEILKKMNPVEHIGDYVASKIKESKSDAMLKSLSYKISERVINNLEVQYQNDIIKPILNNLSEMDKSVESIRILRADKLEKLIIFKKDLEKDINLINKKLNEK